MIDQSSSFFIINFLFRKSSIKVSIQGSLMLEAWKSEHLISEHLTTISFNSSICWSAIIEMYM